MVVKTYQEEINEIKQIIKDRQDELKERTPFEQRVLKSLMFTIAYPYSTTEYLNSMSKVDNNIIELGLDYTTNHLIIKINNIWEVEII